MTQDNRTVRAEKRQNRAYRATFVYQGPFKKEYSTASRVVNEVILGTRVNKIPFGYLRRHPSGRQPCTGRSAHCGPFGQGVGAAVRAKGKGRLRPGVAPLPTSTRDDAVGTRRSAKERSV